MSQYLGIFIVALAIGVVVWLARSIGAEGVATSLDAPWGKFCEKHRLDLLLARPLVGEKWPMIAGFASDVAVSIDVFEEQVGVRKLVSTRLRAASSHVRAGVLRVCSRAGASVTSGRVIATGDTLFDADLVAFADTDDVARVLGDAGRSALLELAQRRRVHLEVDGGAITLLIRDVIHRSDELALAMDAVVQIAGARPTHGYR